MSYNVRQNDSCILADFNALPGHRFDPDTPISETVSLIQHSVRRAFTERILKDASPARRRERRLCSLYWHVLVLGVSMSVLSHLVFHYQIELSSYFQSTLCKVGELGQWGPLRCPDGSGIQITPSKPT
jgi:hypothetical protein